MNRVEVELCFDKGIGETLKLKSKTLVGANCDKGEKRKKVRKRYELG